ncbi:MAG: hypothetical protein FWB80_06960 [Defluviitaleaceae bacterium]|nr:hypothetical protein [Defluviitaleaceae bacterium]
MAQKINDTNEMSFMKIGETYPDDYILVRIIKMNNETGVHTGKALYTSAKKEDLYPYAEKESTAGETITLQGENLRPILGGFL